MAAVDLPTHSRPRGSPSPQPPARADGGLGRQGGHHDRIADRGTGPGTPARLFFWVAVAAVVSTYLLIVAGAVVRVTGSGDGCGPDWPTCQGRLLPPFEPAALIEFTHRLAAAISSTLILTIPVAALLWRRERRILVPAIGIPVLLACQVVLGAIVVWLGLPPMAVLVHLGFAMLILGGMVWIAVQAAAPPAPPAIPMAAALAATAAPAAVPVRRHYVPLLGAAAVAVYALILTGAYTRATGASSACLGFPGCRVPAEAVQAVQDAGGPDLVATQLLHRTVAYLASVLVAAAVAETWRLRRAVPALRRTAWLLLVTLIVQVLIGVGLVETGLPTVLRGAHVAGAAAVWASAVLLLALARRVGPRLVSGTGDARDPLTASQTPAAQAAGGAGPRFDPMGTALPFSVAARVGLEAQEAGSTGVAGDGEGEADEAEPEVPPVGAARLRAKLGAYYRLTKFNVIVLLEVPTLAAMLVASPRLPSPVLVVATLLGGALAAGGAAAINSYVDRDIDAVMGRRTRKRPVPAGLIGAGEALAFGLALAVASFFVLAFFANFLAAFLAQFGLLVYVFVYTLWLKRSTPSNIVIGGAAGAIPPLVGWAAVTGEVGPVAWLLFAIIFFWTPPHFWSLALVLRQHYARANVPMLPVVRGDAEARRQIVYYTLQLIAVTVLLFALRLSGLFYLGSALLLGAVFLYYAARLWREATNKAAWRLFHYSMLYLWLLCAALVLDKRVFG